MRVSAGLTEMKGCIRECREAIPIQVLESIVDQCSGAVLGLKILLLKSISLVKRCLL